MVNPQKLPKHVAIIMDGNGRWAAGRGLPRVAGHREGALALRRLVSDVSGMGIDALTVYAFSTENWSRPQSEINALFGMIADFFHKHINELVNKNVRVSFLGEFSGLPADTQKVCARAESVTRGLTGMRLNIALNYGGRAEIVRAAKLLCEKAQRGQIDPTQVDEAAVEGCLYTAGLPDVDLLIRTSGERRLSGFLLYQCAYAEIVFTDTLWPDFTTRMFNDALAEFAARDRRFGDVTARRTV